MSPLTVTRAARSHVPYHPIGASQVASAMAAALKGMTYTSESDYPFTALSASNPGKKPVSGPLVLDKFKPQLAKMFKDDLDASPFSVKNLATEVWSPKETQDWLKSNAEASDPSDADGVKYAKAFGQVRKLIDANLTDVRMVKVGVKDEHGKFADDQGLYALMLVGRTRDGQIAGIMTGTVET